VRGSEAGCCRAGAGPTIEKRRGQTGLQAEERKGGKQWATGRYGPQGFSIFKEAFLFP
jgi:hypothetical protein